MNLVLRRREGERATCAVCRDDAHTLDACRGCGATTHADCGAEGCPTIGCAFQREPRRVLPARPVVTPGVEPQGLDPGALRWPTRGDEGRPTRRPNPGRATSDDVVLLLVSLGAVLLGVVGCLLMLLTSPSP